MGAADLLHSALVGADVDGKLIGPIVTAGLPNLQTSMPSYSELTPVQLSELAAYVHYLRQQAKYKELDAAKLPVGDAATGGKYFKEEGRCVNCHTVAALAANREHFSTDVGEPAVVLSSTEITLAVVHVISPFGNIIAA